MRDTLDLQALIQQGKFYQRAQSRFWVRFFLIALIYFILQGFIAAYSQPPVQLLRATAKSWETVQLPPNCYPTAITHTADGTLWMWNGCEDEIWSYAGSVWSVYPLTLPTSSLNNRLLATYGNHVWGVAGTSVIEYDGSLWRVHANVLPDEQIMDLAVSALGVFIVDDNDQLSIFDYSAWSTQSLATLLAYPYAPEYRTLAAGPDGSIYLSYEHIWKFDGLHWVRFLPLPANPSGDYYVYAVADDYLWMYDGYYTGSVSLRDPVPTFKATSIQWYPDAVTLADTTLYSVTADYVYRLDGTTFDEIAPAPTGGTVDSIAVDAAGAVYAVYRTPMYYDRGYRVANAVAEVLNSMLLPLTLLIAFYAYRYRPVTLKRRRPTQQAIWKVLPLAPDDVTIQVGGGIYRTWRIIFFLLVLGAPLTGIVFGTQAPVWILAPYVLALGFGLVPLGLRWRRYLPKTRNLALEDSSVVNAYVSLVSLCGVVPLLVVSEVVFGPFRDFAVFYAAFAVFVILFVAALLLNQVLSRVMLRILRQSLAGEHERVMARLPQYERWLPFGRFALFVRAFNAQLRGQAAEAEGLYRRYIAETQLVPQVAGLGLVNLGQTVKDQGRPVAALPFLECAAQILPESSAPYHELAVYYLEQQSEAARALELTDAMLIFMRKPRGWLQRREYHVSALTRAWALAANNRWEEGAPLVNMVLKSLDPLLIHDNAATYVVLGHIYALLNKDDEARAYYTRALETAPDSMSSREAQAALQNLNGTHEVDPTTPSP